MTPSEPVHLVPYAGTWSDDDPDANFKAEVALRTVADPLPTLRALSANTGIPLGSLVRFVLVRWTSEGTEALMDVGPTMVRRLQDVVADAEEAGTDEARLAAYDQLRQMIGWLGLPLEDDIRADPSRG